MKIQQKNENCFQKVIFKVKSLLQNKKYTIPFLILILLYFLAISAILRANYNYVDDIGRSVGGYRVWSNFSRFFSEYFSILFNTSFYLTDLSPFTQLFSIGLLALSGVIILKLFGQEKKKFSIMAIISVLLIGMNPFFLECLSYKFDCVYISFSVFFSIVPFLFFKRDSMIKLNIPFIIISILGVILMCISYQASSGIYPLITMFLAFSFWKDKGLKDSLSFIFASAISYIIGIFLFQQFIMVSTDTYVSTNIFPFNQILSGVFHNLVEYYSIIIHNFRPIWLIFIALLVILFIFITVAKSKRNKIVTFIFVVVLVCLSGMLCFGLYPALERPLFEPRSMFGFTFFVSLLAINTINLEEKYFSRIIVFVLAYSFMVFSITYGNVLSYQKQYTEFRIQNIINELNDIDYMKSDTFKLVQIDGNIGKTPVLENMPLDYQNMFNQLVRSTFGNSTWMWNYQYFYKYFKIPNIYFDASVDLNEYDLPVLADKMYYTIKGTDEYVLIILK